MNITAVVGARPNFVKIAPILAEMSRYPELRVRLIHTGQHYDVRMSGTFFRDLGLPEPDVDLGIGSASAVVQIAEIMTRLAPVLEADRPDLVVVVGDVNSTLTAALTAAKLRITLAHVEAGLRSFDRAMPEEINRVLTDALADLCFTTEPSANENLAREGIPRERVHHVGNVMIDTLFTFRERAAASPILDTLGVAPHRYAALTLHRPGNVDDPATFERIFLAIAAIQRDVPVVFPVHPRTRERLGRAPQILAGAPSLTLIDPLPYLDFVQLMANAACVLTDSGGIQEETTALGVPCLTLRTTTERPITVAHGTNCVTGVDAERIQEAWRRILQGDWPMGRLPELWDGKAAGRIVRVLVDQRSP